MKEIFDYQSITDAQIEDMLYQISAYADKCEARRFNWLSDERKRKVTYLLRKRALRARNAEKPFDKDIVREIIDCAKEDIYILD